LEHDTETDLRTLTVGKANYARTGMSVRFLWHDGAFVLESDLPAETRKALTETIQTCADDKLFLDCLRLRTGQRRAVSDKQCATYAPKVFGTMPESKGIGSTRLAKAMERLFRGESIERAALWHSDDRKRVYGLRETVQSSAVEQLPSQAENQ
jgi:hypothetical protein